MKNADRIIDRLDAYAEDVLSGIGSINTFNQLNYASGICRMATIAHGNDDHKDHWESMCEIISAKITRLRKSLGTPDVHTVVVWPPDC